MDELIKLTDSISSGLSLHEFNESPCASRLSDSRRNSTPVTSRLAKWARIKNTASKCTCNFDCNWQRVNAFSHCVSLTHVLLRQIISYSAKVLVLVMEWKHGSVIYVYKLIFSLFTSRSTERRIK